MIAVFVLSVVSATLILAFLVFWEQIEAVLYDAYDSSPMRLIVVGWGVITLSGAMATPLSTALQVLRAFRFLALAQILGAITSLSIVAVALLIAPPPVSLLGPLLAEALVLVIFLFALPRRLASVTAGFAEMAIKRL